MRDAWTGRTVRLLVLLGALLGVPIAGHAAAHPDIVFILTDDMSYADLAVMPHTRKLLNDQGTAFRRAYVNVSLCCPSRATILTGRYAQNTGVHRNGGTGGGYKAFVTNGNEEETIGVALSAAGYRTALIGKYINGYPGSDRSHVPPGWSDWAAGMDDIYQQFDYKLNVNGHEEAHGHAAADYAGDVFAGKALDFIDTSVKARKPYFLYLALISPHSPAAAAPRHDKLFPDARVPRTPSFLEVDVSDKPPFYRGPILSSAQIKVLDEAYRRRLRSLQSVDEAVAAIYARLKALGRLDDTYIVFTSDNGFRLGDHRLGIGKETGYEQDIHVPLIVRGPHVPAGRRTDALVDNADLAPTFAAWAGAKPPPDVDGRSLTPLLGGRKPGKWRTSLPVAHWPDSSFVGLDEAEGIFKSLPTPRAPEWHGLRSGRYLFINYTSGDRELYDTDADPYQLQTSQRRPIRRSPRCFTSGPGGWPPAPAAAVARWRMRPCRARPEPQARTRPHRAVSGLEGRVGFRTMPVINLG